MRLLASDSWIGCLITWALESVCFIGEFSLYVTIGVVLTFELFQLAIEFRIQSYSCSVNFLAH